MNLQKVKVFDLELNRDTYINIPKEFFDYIKDGNFPDVFVHRKQGDPIFATPEIMSGKITISIEYLRELEIKFLKEAGTDDLILEKEIEPDPKSGDEQDSSNVLPKNKLKIPMPTVEESSKKKEVIKRLLIEIYNDGSYNIYPNPPLKGLYLEATGQFREEKEGD